MRRRKTSYSFVDDTTLRQRLSVDFTLLPPDKFPTSAEPREGQTIYVPLDIGDKSPRAKFSVTDESGTALSLLNERESITMAVDGTTIVLQGLSSRRARTTPGRETQRAMLRKIFTAPRGEAETLARQALGEGGRLSILLGAAAIYRSLVLELARGRLMLVPVEYEPGASRVIKLDHYLSPAWDHVRSPYRLSRVGLRVLASLSLHDKVMGFTGLPVGLAQSTHFEFEPPEDVNIGVGQLDCDQWDATSKRRLKFVGRKEIYGSAVVDLAVAPRVTIDPHEPNDARRDEMLANLLAARQDRGEVVLRMRPSISNVVTPTVVAASATVAGLWLAFARLGDLDGETSAALLLLFPATIAVLLARPGEHAFATRLLKGFRWVAALVAVCAVAAVGVISGGLIRSDRPPEGRSKMSCTVERPVRKTRAVECVERRPARRRAEVDETARDIVMWAAIAASGMTSVIALALVRTHSLGRRRRRTPPKENTVGVPVK